jgi:drug/metabolite transporter (DMT)-like permease
MRAKPPTYLLWLAIPLLNTLNQACIKLLAGSLAATPFGLSWLQEVLHQPWAFGILACEVTSFVLWMRILSTTSISKASPISALGYISILVMSWTYFHEDIKALQLVGSSLVLLGVWLISSATSPTLTQPTTPHEAL